MCAGDVTHRRRFWRSSTGMSESRRTHSIRTIKTVIGRSFDQTVFTTNRWRMLEHWIGRSLFDQMIVAADHGKLRSDEHFSVGGTLMEAAVGPSPEGNRIRGALR